MSSDDKFVESAAAAISSDVTIQNTPGDDKASLRNNASYSSSTLLIKQVLQQLGESVVYSDPSNVHTNKKLWNTYCSEWNNSSAIPPWLAKMASDVEMSHDLRTIGDEWAPRRHTEEIIRMFILPFIDATSTHAAEIGVGGGTE